MARAHQASNFTAQDTADELCKRIREHEGAFDDAFRLLLAQRVYAQWMSETRATELAIEVGEMIQSEMKLSQDDIGYDWYIDQSEREKSAVIDQQEALVNEIDDHKQSLESHQEIVKTLKASIDEGHTRLRSLARQLKTPWVPSLPPAPSRQREIAFADGEEWRAVPLADVLADDVSLRAIVGEKLGAITLDQYTQEAVRFGQGDKTKKLTRKQWDRVEAAVQAFHSSRQDGDKAAST